LWFDWQYSGVVGAFNCQGGGCSRQTRSNTPARQFEEERWSSQDIKIEKSDKLSEERGSSQEHSISNSNLENSILGSGSEEIKRERERRVYQRKVEDNLGFQNTLEKYNQFLLIIISIV
jgi:Raffinose synthase or seed imbibition protein Sip1